MNGVIQNYYMYTEKLSLTKHFNYSAELSGHFGIDLYETLRHHYTLRDFVPFVAG